MSSASGRLIAERYALGEVLGRGAFGVVFAADDRVTGDRVAVKLIDVANAHRRRRIQREITALRLLRLPGVVRLLDDGLEGDTCFLVMDLIDGDPFPGTGRTWETLRPVVLELLQVVAHVHAAGVMHRDLKPANILVGRVDGRVTLLDFGLSRGEPVGSTMTRSGVMVGTPAYLSPEQIRGERIDARADLYSVGAMAYEALTGGVPHAAPDVGELVRLRLTQPPTPLRRAAPDVPRDVAELVDRLLDPDADNRPASARLALAALTQGCPPELRRKALRWLGPRAPIDAVLQRLAQGRRCVVRGRPGSGRTRALEEVHDAQEQAGYRVRWLVPARSPFGSLSPVTGDLAAEDPLRSLESV